MKIKQFGLSWGIPNLVKNTFLDTLNDNTDA